MLNAQSPSDALTSCLSALRLERPRPRYALVVGRGQGGKGESEWAMVVYPELVRFSVLLAEEWSV